MLWSTFLIFANIWTVKGDSHHERYLQGDSNDHSDHSILSTEQLTLSLQNVHLCREGVQRSPNSLRSKGIQLVLKILESLVFIDWQSLYCLSNCSNSDPTISLKTWCCGVAQFYIYSIQTHIHSSYYLGMDNPRSVLLNCILLIVHIHTIVRLLK